jgi:hypothetical protein
MLLPSHRSLTLKAKWLSPFSSAHLVEHCFAADDGTVASVQKTKILNMLMPCPKVDVRKSIYTLGCYCQLECNIPHKKPAKTTRSGAITTRSGAITDEVLPNAM